MHKNTFILILFLAVFAAIVTGVNIGSSTFDSQAQKEDSHAQIISPTTSPSPSELIRKSGVYILHECGLSLTIPDHFELSGETSKSAIFMRQSPKNSIIVTCQEKIQKPAVTKEFTEKVLISNTLKTSTFSAILYHDKTLGENIDALIYYDPRIKEDVLLAGYGSDFDTMLTSVRLIE